MAWTLVTGGAKRLGAVICEELAKQGAHVVVHYHTSHEEALEVVQRCQSYGVPAAAIQGDFSSVTSVNDFIQRYLEQFPETIHLINNVGNYLIKSALQTDTSEWLDLFQTNLHTPFVLIKALTPSLIRHQGAIINLGSTRVKTIQANVRCTAYQLTKTALWMLTCSLARELAPAQVRVNMVSPGVLDIAVDLEDYTNHMPMHRPGQCEEVARVITFLLNPASAYITGQNIEVAGGFGV